MPQSYHNLVTAPATITLRRLAEKPYDLSVAGALHARGRIGRYICDSRHYRLLYATQRITAQELTALQELADECGLVEQFRAMRRGAVLNKIRGYASEERQVLHTACRDFFSGQPKEPATTARARKELDKLKAFLGELESGAITNAAGEPFATMVQVGIGGSDLGPRAIYEALKPYGLRGRNVRFIANVDPDDAAAVLEEVDLSKTLVNIVSKSGSTLETLTNERLVTDRLRAAGLDPARHCLAVTGEGSPMDDPSRYLRSFYMFDSIGGRYSATSMVGAVMLGFYLGFEQLMEFLEGAAQSDEEAEESDACANLPLLLALLGVWNHNFLGAPTLALLPYSQALHRFPAHLQQCDMESNGKSVDRNATFVEYKTGPVVWGEPGTNGQHAFYQLLHQGTEIVPVEFIGFRQSQHGVDERVKGTTSQDKLVANLLAQAIALATGRHDGNPNKVFAGNRPSSILLAERLTPRTMGALLAIYEAKIVFQGFLWNINSFDQEGVQLGKQLSARILAQMQSGVGDGESVEEQFLAAFSAPPSPGA